MSPADLDLANNGLTPASNMLRKFVTTAREPSRRHAAILVGVRLEVQPVRTEEDLERFSSVLLEVARWLEAKGHPMWTANELVPKVLLESYGLEEMRLGLLSGEAVAAMVVQESDEFFWPDVTEGESLFVHKLAAVRHLKGSSVAAEMLDWAKVRAREQGKTTCAWTAPLIGQSYAVSTRSTDSAASAGG